MLQTIDAANDDFIRTTEPRHTRRVQEFWATLNDKGDVYQGSYEGPYCVPCEEFKLESELVDGTGDLAGQKLCPIHGRPVEYLSEQNYFFRLSAYADRLLELYETHPEFVQPSQRPQRGGVLRPAGAPGPLDLPFHLQLGHPDPVGRQARPLRVDRRPAQLPECGRVRRRRRRREVRPHLAAGRAPGRQGHPPVPRRHLAGDAAGSRRAPAEDGVRARLAARRRREDEQVQAHGDPAVARSSTSSARTRSATTSCGRSSSARTARSPGRT